VGDSERGSFGNGDWTNVTRRGSNDGIIVKYDQHEHVPVAGITGVPGKATAGTDLILTGAATPSDATRWMISWSVKDAGDTGAAITATQRGEVLLSTTGTGTAIITASIEGGISPGVPFETDFTITVTERDDIVFTFWMGVVLAFSILCIVCALILFRLGRRCSRSP
jgi:hypothetical protein